MKNYAQKSVDHFLTSNEPKRFDKYIVTKNSLVYRALVTKEIRLPYDEVKRKAAARQLLKASMKNQLVIAEDKGIESLREIIDGKASYNRFKVQALQENIIAVKVPNEQGEIVLLGNSAVLSLIGRRVSFGHEKMNRTETDVQALLAQKIPMLPFNVFEQTGLDLRKIKILERGPEEKLVRKIQKYNTKTKKHDWIDETIHFTGASLFTIEGKYFIFDVDRRELEHKVFNPFLAELPFKVNTIKQAYDSLKPKEVLEAESKGLKVKRQGEWFFIPVEYSGEPDLARREDVQWQGKYRRMVLQAGDNRPNHASLGVADKMLVKGKISHTGREHADLILKTWHKAVPNTATKSFTITGDID